MREERIDCAFERLPGYLFAPEGESPDELMKELEAAGRLGYANVERVERAPLPGWDTGPAVRFGSLGQFHPLE